MAERMPDGQPVGSVQVTFSSPPDGKLGDELTAIARELGCTVTDLQGVMFVVQSPYGDELAQKASHRLFGRHYAKARRLSN